MLRPHDRWILILAAAALVVLLATARGYLPFVADDALISFRYSERLLDGKGLTFTDGERVEGYSNLLWVLTVAAGGLITRDLILVGRVEGVIAACLAVLAFVPVARAVAARDEGLHAGADALSALRAAMPAAAVFSLLALSHGLAIWAIGGLEQSLLSALLVWAMTLIVMPSLRAGAGSGSGADAEGAGGADVPVAAGVILALLVWTRPDGALFVALAAAALVLVHGASIATVRGIVKIAALPAAAWLAQLAFRLVYYNDWVPNTAYAKVALSKEHFWSGLHYIGEGLWMHAALVAAAATGLFFARPFRRREIVVPLVAAMGWSAYVISVGGDIFPGRRHFLPVLWCLAMLVAVTWRRGLGRLPLAAQVVVLVIFGSVHAYQQRGDHMNVNARIEMWEWSCGQAMAPLRTAFAGTQPLVAADAIGCVGYFGKLPMLDMLGLTDRYLAHNPPPDFGTGYVGHELGDGRYILSRSPAIVVPCVPGMDPNGCFRSGREIVALPEFQQRYTLVSINVRELLYRPSMWFDTTSPRLGVVQNDREIRLPGFLFANPNAGYAMLSTKDRLVGRLWSDIASTLDKPAVFASDAGSSWTGRAIASQPMEVSIEGSTIRVKTGPLGGELSEVVLSR